MADVGTPSGSAHCCRVIRSPIDLADLPPTVPNFAVAPTFGATN